MLQGNCSGWPYDDTGFIERLSEPKWAAFEMALETILASRWGAAVKLEERDEERQTIDLVKSGTIRQPPSWRKMHAQAVE